VRRSRLERVGLDEGNWTSAAFTADVSTRASGVPIWPDSACSTAAASKVCAPITVTFSTANSGLYAAPSVPSTSARSAAPTVIQIARAGAAAR
jgi:hypothetical protein